MIKTVIFDFGQVIVHFEPEYMVGKYVSDKNDKEILKEVVFDRQYWDPLDKGTITDIEVLDACKKRLPERLWDLVDTIYYNWVYNIPLIDGMEDVVKYLKEEKNVQLLLLSNISKYFVAHSGEIPIISLFDGCVFSSLLGVTKPSREIFEYIARTYNVNPSEAIFIDDNRDNIKGANEFGLNGYVFDGDAKKLKAYLDTIL